MTRRRPQSNPTERSHEHDSAQPKSLRRGRHMADSSAPRNRAGHVSTARTASPLDDGAIAAVKGRARLANAAGVEPPSSTPRPWAELTPAEKRAAVKERILGGKSWREIADELGIPNRNIIAGITTRLRELGELPPARSKKAVGKDGGQVVRAKAQARRKPKASGLAAINIAVRTEHRAEAPGIAISRAAAFEPIPGVEPVAFVDNHGCRWPVDGIDGPGLLACGEAKEPEHVYCAAHRRLAYTSQHERAA